MGKWYQTFILLWICIPMFGQVMPRIISFPKSEYQARNQNWMIDQTEKGRMIFANSAGVLSFNGVNWSTTPLPQKQFIRAVYIRNEKIFVGAFDEFGYFETIDNQLDYHSISDGFDSEGKTKEEIWNIIGRDSSILFQSFGKIFEFRNGKVIEIIPPFSIGLISKVREKLYLQVNGKGLMQLTEFNQFKLICDDPLLQNENIRFILPYAQEALLVGTEKAGVYLYNDGKLTIWEPALQPFFRQNQLNKALQLENGNYCFGTILNGVIIVNPNGETITYLNKNSGLQNNTVLSIYADKINNLWLGLDNGIDLVEINSPIAYFPDLQGRIGSVFDAFVHHGFFYIGSNQGLFYRPIEDEQAPFRLVENMQGQVWDLEEFNGQLLCGHNTGTYHIKNGIARQISAVSGGWQMVKVPKNPNQLIQSTYTGLVLFQNINNEWQFVKKIAGLSDIIRKIAFDSEQNLWAVNPYHGLYKLSFDDDFNISEKVVIDESFGIPNLDHLDLIEVNNQILVLSDQKFYHFEDDRFTTSQLFSKNEEIAWEKVFPINNSELLLWEPGRLHLIKEGTLRQTITIDQNLVLESTETLENGHLILGFDKGFGSWRAHEEVFQARPEVEISLDKACFWLNNLNRQICYEQENFTPEVNRNQSNVQFQYSLPVYTNSPNFRYRLLGFENFWSTWSQNSYKEYTNLPKGDYIFEIEAKEATAPLQFHFMVRPYWYDSTLAYFTYPLLAIALFVSLYQWHIKRLNRQHRRLKLEKERELIRQRLIAQNEKLTDDVQNKSKDLTRSTMNLIYKNDALIKIQKQLDNVKKDLGSRLPDKYYLKLNLLIEDQLSSEKDKHLFESNFEEVYDAFYQRLKGEYPNLTPSDLKLAGYLKMNLSTKEIAPLMNITIRGLENKRYRLRKKLGLDSQENLIEFLLQK